jgi:hypothetical protein
MLLAAALLALPSSGIGAPYPGASLLAPPEQKSCYVRYRASTGASIAQVAQFYSAQAERGGAPLAADTKAQFPDYRTLTFITQPNKFEFVILDRKDGRTIVVVSYRTMAEADCRKGMGAVSPRS